MSKIVPLFAAVPLLAALFFLTACESPVSQHMSTGAKDFQNAMVGYEETTYEYPVKMPGTNRWVKIISPKPIDRPLTYDDYLAWKEHGDEALFPKTTEKTTYTK